VCNIGVAHLVLRILSETMLMGFQNDRGWPCRMDVTSEVWVMSCATLTQ
jgi:hypothetical protein